MTATSSYAFRAQLECEECGYPVVLEGPGQASVCDACRAPVDLPAAVWAAVLAMDDATVADLAAGGQRRSRLFTGGWWLTVSCRVGQPDAEAPARAVPADLQRLVPKLVTIHGGPSVPAEAQPASIPDEGNRPVALSCVQCGGDLRIDRQAPRIVTCRYCDTDYFLPESLWRHLHPVRRKPIWWGTFASAEAGPAVGAGDGSALSSCVRCGAAIGARQGYRTENGLVCDRCFAG